MAPRIRTPSSWHHHLPYPSSSGIPPTTLSNPLSYPITYARALAAVGHRRHPILLYPGLFQAPPPSLHPGTGASSTPRPHSPTSGARPLSNLCRSQTGSQPLSLGLGLTTLHPSPRPLRPPLTAWRVMGTQGLGSPTLPPSAFTTPLFLIVARVTGVPLPGHIVTFIDCPAYIWSRVGYLDSICSEYGTGS